MPVHVTQATVKSILTRSSGFLRTVCSHSLQPYRGCTFGGALCGVGCYARHNVFLTRGDLWGGFLEVRTNAADVYVRQYERERCWARWARGRLAVFLSSSTDPFLPQEDRFRITESVLGAMLHRPPDALILQTHTHRVASRLELCLELARRTELRVHLSVESDRDRLPGLPPPASSVERRLAAAARLKEAGLTVVIAVAPLLPIEDPPRFFRRLAECSDAVILDHFIGGDGSPDGARTLKTALPAAMAAIDPLSVRLEYRDRMVAEARRAMPGRVGVGIDGFAGRFE